MNSPTRKRLSVPQLNQLRRQAVELRLDGKTLSETQQAVGLTAPTIIAACKAYKDGGWSAVSVGQRGRPRLKSDGQDLQEIKSALTGAATIRAGIPAEDLLWNIEKVRLWAEQTGYPLSHAGWLKLMEKWSLSPQSRYRQLRAQLRSQQAKEASESENTNWLTEHAKFSRKARSSNQLVLWVASRKISDSHYQIYAHDLRGHAHWCLTENTPTPSHYLHFFQALDNLSDQGLALVLTNYQLMRVPELATWATDNVSKILYIDEDHRIQSSYQTRTTEMTANHPAYSAPPDDPAQVADLEVTSTLTHLQRLEAESIHIMREVVAEAENPVMLYSIGKDSAVMLHLARKAFFPAPPPFPLLHVDTTWKFKAMYEFRDSIAERYGLELMVHVNPEGVRQNVNPFTHGSSLHTDIMKTQGLKQALDEHRFDFAFGGARRDEEKSRAKERVFSFRNAQHRWDAKNQRPELWQLYNARKQRDESIRVFPLSNWTELDIWQYIHKEDIPIVPLYMAGQRPVVERDGTLIMVDDDRMPLNPGEVPEMRSVRFRTLGCYPLTGAVESTASTLEEIIQEMLLTRTSERQGRMIDHDSSASMEKKKQEGYF